MFQGWGVGLTMTDLGGPSTAGWPVPAGVIDRPSRLSEVLPVAVRSDAEIAWEHKAGHDEPDPDQGPEREPEDRQRVARIRRAGGDGRP